MISDFFKTHHIWATLVSFAIALWLESQGKHDTAAAVAGMGITYLLPGNPVLAALLARKAE
jgi:hypothetical protein